MEQNVIFMYPLCPVLTQLKSELEKDSTLTVFEVDMVEEYCQLIPSLEGSITFSADLKKTTKYLESLKSYLTKKNHFNIFVSKQLPSGLAMTKMEKNGLNEAYPDYTKLAVLQKKVDSFFKVSESFETSGDNKKTLEKNSQSQSGSDLKLEKLFTPNKLSKDSSDLEEQEREKKKASEAAALDELLGDVKTRDSASLRGEDPLTRTQAAYEGDLRTEKKDWAPYTGEAEKTKTQAAYEGDLRTEKKDWAPYTGEAEKSKTQAAYEGDLSKKKQGLTALQDKTKLEVKHLPARETPELKLEEIPEVIFYSATKVLDPVAFFVEIMVGNWEPDFKKKFLKMSLLKVYQAQIFITQHDGSWEEEAPEKLKSIKASDFLKPVWIDEGTNLVENIFILPVAFDEKIVGSVGLIIPGKLDHAKMGEMEFWCYLGRCLWS